MTAAVRTADWRDSAACRAADPRLFFGPDGERAPERAARESEAKDFCRRCPAAAACFTFAYARPETIGVWGGTTEDERSAYRRRIRRAIRKAAAA